MEKLKTNLANYNNSWYQPGPLIKRVCWYVVSSLVFQTSLFPFPGLKVILLRLFGAKVGKRVRIKPSVTIKYPWFLHVDHDSWIGENVWIDNLAMVTIGSNTCLSQGCTLLTGNHDYTKTGFDLVVKSIVLEDGVWIGAGAVVCGGVVARDHSVLLAASVATRHLDAYSVYRGNPAVKVKERILREQ